MIALLIKELNDSVDKRRKPVVIVVSESFVVVISLPDYRHLSPMVGISCPIFNCT